MTTTLTIKRVNRLARRLISRVYAAGEVYRLDEDPISDFSQNLRTYYRKPDWSSSGTFEEEIPQGWQKETGLFAGNRRHVVPYAVPRDVSWIVIREDPKRPTLVFNESDKQKIAQHRSHLSQFSGSGFTKVPSGEYFSEKPSIPERQEVIRNPIRFMQQWYDVKFVPDIKQLATQLRKQNIQFESEGL